MPVSYTHLDVYKRQIQDNVIAVLGKDTDAAFYGLSSLKMIFNQVTEKAVRQLQIEDYASGQYRGFIEGYYGIPWSVEDRIRLMKSVSYTHLCLRKDRNWMTIISEPSVSVLLLI